MCAPVFYTTNTKVKRHAAVLSHARCDNLLLYLTYIAALCVFRQVDVNSKNVFGQPRLRASLRDLRSPRRSHKSTVEDDLKKLIIMDSPGEIPQRDMVRDTQYTHSTHAHPHKHSTCIHTHTRPHTYITQHTILHIHTPNLTTCSHTNILPHD